jgi:hypothetical protein
VEHFPQARFILDDQHFTRFGWWGSGGFALSHWFSFTAEGSSSVNRLP